MIFRLLHPVAAPHANLASIQDDSSILVLFSPFAFPFVVFRLLFFRQSLLMPSYECRHAIRTPLMCAVMTGNFAIFKTILHAFNQLFTSPVRICSHSYLACVCCVCIFCCCCCCYYPLLLLLMMMILSPFPTLFTSPVGSCDYCCHCCYSHHHAQPKPFVGLVSLHTAMLAYVVVFGVVAPWGLLHIAASL